MSDGVSDPHRKVRVDAWLWAIRLFKTRSQAHAACEAGHVQVHGERAKPATGVSIGDEVTVRGGERPRIVVVRELLVKRVGAPIAAAAYEDHSPPPPLRSTGIRDRGAGRPTKADRRAIDKLRGHHGGPGQRARRDGSR
ncbi:MAG: RNA-binding S4 domain-containing protein [Bifidobacteriaceae bacterium]|jgi:ribosome-associated heat shock protein Hsp15|nr:RNA-binding S4 domain-containing protein [Bifidobacteriaceae bacterium]